MHGRKAFNEIAHALLHSIQQRPEENERKNSSPFQAQCVYLYNVHSFFFRVLCQTCRRMLARACGSFFCCSCYNPSQLLSSSGFVATENEIFFQHTPSAVCVRLYTKSGVLLYIVHILWFMFVHKLATMGESSIRACALYSVQLNINRIKYSKPIRGEEVGDVNIMHFALYCYSERKKKRCTAMERIVSTFDDVLLVRVLETRESVSRCCSELSLENAAKHESRAPRNTPKTVHSTRAVWVGAICGKCFTMPNEHLNISFESFSSCRAGVLDTCKCSSGNMGKTIATEKWRWFSMCTYRETSRMIRI